MSTLQKYKNPPEDEEEFDTLFEQMLSDMMMKEELRIPMRSRSRQDKWMIIKNQIKSNLKGNFTMLSALELLNGVCNISCYHAFRSPFPVTRHVKWTP